MAKARTGTIRRLPDGRWKIGVRAPGGRRAWLTLPKGTSEPKARERARYETEQAAGLAQVAQQEAKAAPKGETVSAYSERWLAERERRGLVTVRDDRGRLGKWVLPTLGGLPIVAVSRDEVRAWVEQLDEQVRDGALSWKTAWNAWGLCRKLLDDSANSKAEALRMRKDNPAAGVRGPDRGTDKVGTYLYPSEFLALMSCADVPLAWRRSAALAIYLGPRAAELRALTWGDVDLEHGSVHVHHSVDREGRDKPTKTKRARRFAIEPALLPLLRAMHDESEGRGRVVELPDDRHLARGLRGVLEQAGIDRPELYADDETRRPLTWHDLRGTACTWWAVRGDEPLKIQQRAGHTTFSTTQRYIREAEAVQEGFGEVFPELPPCLLVAVGSCLDPTGGNSAELQWSRRESNPSCEPHCTGVRRVPDAIAATTDAMGVDRCANARQGSNQDPIEAALVRALDAATATGNMDAIVVVATELRERRLAAAGVVQIKDRARSKAVEAPGRPVDAAQGEGYPEHGQGCSRSAGGRRGVR